jgi:hypothetical protein
MAKKVVTGKKESGESQKETAPNKLAFDKTNYYIILGGVGLLILGYILMIGGGSDDPNQFNPEIFSAQRITVAPVTLLLGFAVVLYGIMKSPKKAE